MVVRGDSGEVREFLPNALDAAKTDARRVVVWVRDQTLLSEQETEELFQGDEAILATVLGSERVVKAWVYRDQLQVADADYAFGLATES
jgi:hypothetical protein